MTSASLGLAEALGEETSAPAAEAPSVPKTPTTAPAPTAPPEPRRSAIPHKAGLGRPQPLARTASGAAPDQHPTPLVVDGATTSWRPGSTYRGVFADPDVAYSDGRWYAYATNTSGLRLPTLASADLTHWQPLHTAGDGRYDALARVGAWTTQKSGGAGLWAPSVARMGEGWTLAYAGQQSTLRGERHNCIGLARAARPTGPFEPLATPLECATASPQGAIDPDLVVDAAGRNWMLWKFSGVPAGQPSTVYIRQLDAQGTGWAPGSRATALVSNDYGDSFEGPTIENPSMVTFGGVTYLFYSVNDYRTASYATGYAVCATPTGPCHKAGPLLTTGTAGTLGPGGASAFVTGGSLYLMYHAWDPGRVGVLRRMHIASLLQLPDRTLALVHAG